MPRAVQTSWPVSSRRLVAKHMGDSLTHDYTLGVMAAENWPALLSASLRSLGVPIHARNFGRSGDNTVQMLYRSVMLSQDGAGHAEPADLLTLWGGHNDRSAVSITGITSTGGTATATVAADRNPPVGSQVTVAGADQSAYNGTVTVLAQPTTTSFTYAVSGSPTSPATGTITYTLPYDQTTAHLVTLGERHFSGDDGQLLVVCSTHFQNFASGGDVTAGTPVGPLPASGARLSLYDAQSDAFDTLSAAFPDQVVWVDLYGAFYAYLVAHPDKVGDDTFWHVAAGNTHHNAVGKALVAQFVLAAIQDQAADWLSAVTASDVAGGGVIV